MALLKKLKIQSGVQNKKYEDVPVTAHGDDSEIRVQKMDIAGKLRLSELNVKIDEMKIKDSKKLSLLQLTATFMCVMVDEDGQYLFPDDDVVDVMNTLDHYDVFFDILAASNRINSVELHAKEDTLDKAKKNS